MLESGAAGLVLGRNGDMMDSGWMAGVSCMSIPRVWRLVATYYSAPARCVVAIYVIVLI